MGPDAKAVVSKVEDNRGEGRLHEPCVLAPARGVPGDLPVAGVGKRAGVVPLEADPHAGGIRDDARPSDSRAATSGSPASPGLPAWALSLALEYALTRPLPPRDAPGVLRVGHLVPPFSGTSTAEEDATAEAQHRSAIKRLDKYHSI